MDKADMRQLLEMSITAGSKGAKAAEISLIRSVVIALLEQLPTTAPTTPSAPMKDARSDVDEWMQETAKRLLAASITLLTPQSSQSDQPDTTIGRVEHDLDCVHHWSTFHEEFGKAHYRVVTSGNLHHYSTLWCQKCGALRLSGAILVPAVHQHLLISAKQPLKESVENSQGESVQSLSSELIEGYCEFNNMIYGPSERAVHMLRFPSHNHTDWLKEY